MSRPGNKGFVTEIVIILIALVVLYALGFNFQHFLNSSIVQKIVHAIVTGWETLWSHGLGKIITFAWNNGVILWHLGWNGLIEIISKISSLIPG